MATDGDVNDSRVGDVKVGVAPVYHHREDGMFVQQLVGIGLIQLSESQVQISEMNIGLIAGLIF